MDVAITLRADAFPGLRCGPHRDVAVGVQVRDDVVDVVPGDSAAHAWRIAVTRTDDGDWRGPAVHGKRGERFLYLVWIGRVGDAAPTRFRRAKLQLDAVPPELGGWIVAELGLTDAKGMPVCASVRPPAIRWSVDCAGERNKRT